MFEALFVNRSVQYHKDMNYHVIDDENNYSAKSIERLVGMMAGDGALFVGSDDYDDRFSITILENRIIVGIGLMIADDVFRVLLNDGEIQDYDLSGNLLE